MILARLVGMTKGEQGDDQGVTKGDQGRSHHDQGRSVRGRTRDQGDDQGIRTALAVIKWSRTSL